MSMDLKVFYNGSDYVIARDVADAMAVLAEVQGEPDPEYQFGECRGDSPIRIWCSLDGKEVVEFGDDCGALVEKTAAEWAKRGRGYLCSEDV